MSPPRHVDAMLFGRLTMLSRRSFLTASAATFCHPGLFFSPAARAPAQSAPVTRPNIAEIDRSRILAAAEKALARPLAVNLDLRSPNWLAFTLDIPALAAAAQVDPTKAGRYGAQAATLLNAWLIAPGASLPATPKIAAFESLLDRVGLAELAVAMPFLILPDPLRMQLRLWFEEYLDFLTSSRTALLARDAADHHGSSWLLQSSAAARFASKDDALSECRHRFKAVTIRAQIDANGFFPHELQSAFPFRNSLFNLDLLAGACMLLSTNFESMWNVELQDGPGMRSAMARHATYIGDRSAWPYPADPAFFHQLPYRRPALVFAARAYAHAEYATLWRELDPDPTEPVLLERFPIRQPLLWLTQPRPQPAPA